MRNVNSIKKTTFIAEKGDVFFRVVYFSTYTYPPYSTSDLHQIRYTTHPTY